MVQTQEQEERVVKTLRLFVQLQTWRTVFAEQWEEVAALIYPECRNTFIWNSYSYPGRKFTDRQLDSTGMLALQKFATIVQSLLTPPDAEWHSLSTTNPYLNKNRRVAMWFEAATKILFAHRNAPTANFLGQSYANYVNLGAFGTHGMFVDELQDDIYGRQGIRYKAVPLGELFLYENPQGQIDGFVRYFRMTALQAYEMFGEEGFPEELRNALNTDDQFLYEFIHHVGHRQDFDPARKGPRGMPWRSDYISITGKCLCREGGYRTMPLAVGRYTQAPREIYGRSPAMQVLPSLKTLNEIAGMQLKIGHRTADPVLLVYDDGLIDGVNLIPGALNPGGVSAQGQPLVHPLPVGNFEIGLKAMEYQHATVKDAFLVSLFDILIATPEMTATQVIERVQEKGVLLAPMVGRQSEYLGPMIDRELDILVRLKKLPPMPRELIEAKGEYQVEYTSPLNRYMRSGEIAGASRVVEFATQVVQVTQDLSIMDKFNFDNIIDNYADIQGVPPSWLNDDKTIANIRQNRQQQEQQKMQLQALPNQAAMLKAQAAMKKAGMDTGQGGGQQDQEAPPGQGQAPAQFGPPPSGQQQGMMQ